MGGLVTGFVLASPIFATWSAKGPFYHDKRYWHMPGFDADLEKDDDEEEEDKGIAL